MVVTCEIHFEQNPFGTFYTGQLVNGSVVLKADKAKDVRGVLLKVSGNAGTKWFVSHFNRRQLYFGREDYLSTLTYLIGSGEDQRCTIKAGTHTYNFSCQLPYTCPSSFEGHYGYIRYMIKVTLIRPWKFDQSYTRGFTVLRTVDLNHDTPLLRIPTNTSAYKIFCCGPLKTEPLKMELHLPQAGYVAGQKIPATALIVNNTKIPVAQLEFSLVMLVRYYSQHPTVSTEIERIVVTTVKGESVLRNCTRSITRELHVPATPPTCLRFCNIIQIAYQVELEVKMKGFHGNQVICIPVTIGNVPLMRNETVTQQPSSNHAAAEISAVANKKENELPITAVQPSAPSRNSNIPPPSYEESVHTVRGDMNEDELHAFGPCEFAPLYPVFKIPTVANSNEMTMNVQNSSYTNPAFVL